MPGLRGYRQRTAGTCALAYPLPSLKVRAGGGRGVVLSPSGARGRAWLDGVADSDLDGVGVGANSGGNGQRECK
jgi:hypothetical protein